MTDENQSNENSIFERIGIDVTQSLVDKMYDKVLSDPLLEPFFRNTDMDRQRRSQFAFMIMASGGPEMVIAFGGPKKYTGKDLAEAHKGLVKHQGLSDEHFDAFLGHFKASIEELGLSADIIDEFLALMSSSREAVLGRSV